MKDAISDGDYNEDLSKVLKKESLAQSKHLINVNSIANEKVSNFSSKGQGKYQHMQTT